MAKRHRRLPGMRTLQTRIDGQSDDTLSLVQHDCLLYWGAGGKVLRFAGGGPRGAHGGMRESGHGPGAAGQGGAGTGPGARARAGTRGHGHGREGTGRYARAPGLPPGRCGRHGGPSGRAGTPGRADRARRTAGQEVPWWPAWRPPARARRRAGHPGAGAAPCRWPPAGAHGDGRCYLVRCQLIRCQLIRCQLTGASSPGSQATGQLPASVVGDLHEMMASVVARGTAAGRACRRAPTARPGTAEYGTSAAAEDRRVADGLQGQHRVRRAGGQLSRGRRADLRPTSWPGS